MNQQNRHNHFKKTMSDNISGKSDFGPKPFVTDIHKATLGNNNFRTALWTGNYLQLTLMCIPIRSEIGLEVHSDHDQFLRIESGNGLVKMGAYPENLDYQKNISAGSAVFIPAGTYHNLINVGNKPIRLYSIYAPPEHPHGTIHQTKEIADMQEEHYRHQ